MVGARDSKIKLRSQIKYPIDNWTPQTEDDVIFKKYNTKIIQINFDRIVTRVTGEDLSQKNQSTLEKFDKLSKFTITGKKSAFHKLLGSYCNYLNYFEKFYDPDNELLLAYLHIKFLIDMKISKYDFIEFKNNVLDTILRPSLVDKIWELVNDNYFISLLPEREANKKHKNYREVLEFNNYHGKLLMAVSVTCRVLIPLIGHYIHKKGIKNEVNSYLFEIFKDISYKFDPNVDLYNKLYETASYRLKRSEYSNQTHYRRIQITGDTVEDYIDAITMKIYTDAIPKFIFSKNCMSFITAVSRITINNFYKVKDKKNLNEISRNSGNDDEDLSKFDDMEMRSIQNDESDLILAELNLELTIRRLYSRYNVELDIEEYEYYLDNIQINQVQIDLVFLFFSNHFGKELYHLKYDWYVQLLILLKKILLECNFKLLPYLLTAKVDDLVIKSRLPKKDKIKIETSALYDVIVNKYSYSIDLIRDSKIIEKFINSLLRSSFIVVDYETRNTLMNRKLDIIKHRNTLFDEIMRFIVLI